MPAEGLAYTVACPSCERPAGERCVSPTGRHGPTQRRRTPHVQRERRAIAEHTGPQEGDVVYLDDHKHRVLGDGIEGEVRYKGRSATIFTIARDQLAYDAVAGMWRAK